MIEQPISFYNIINSKVVDHSEIVLILFDHCNLSCAFCPQEHDDMTGSTEEEIMKKVPLVVDFINNNRRSKEFYIHTMGGELFQDYWIEKGYLDIYQKFIDEVIEKVDKDKKVIFNFVTNLIFTQTEKIFNFLEKNNLNISSSYDMAGRFNSETLNVFKNNFQIFKDKIKTVNVVLTKQNIQSLMRGDDFFDHIYQNCVIDFDSFLPAGKTETNKFQMPSEKNTFEFYKLLVDKYPNVLNVASFVGKEKQNKMTCTRGNNFTVLKNNFIPEGCSGSVFLADRKSDEVGSPKIIQNFIEKYNCFSCEYYQKCSFTCFIKHDFKFIEEDMNTCLYKEVFKYVDDKKSLAN